MHHDFRLARLFLLIPALCLALAGCSGSGSSADPMGTGTIQFVGEYTAPYGTGNTVTAPVLPEAEVAPNSSVTLRVWVSNFTAEGKTTPVINEKVTFWLDSPENGGRLSVLNARTASNGQASVVYTAGNNLYPDVVRAATSVGATASVRIKKSGTAIRGTVVTLTAAPSTVAPLGHSTLTATVTDGGYPVPNDRVTFSLLTSDNGGALSLPSGTSDANGQVSTIYTAGNNNYEDVIQASIGSGAKVYAIIKKSGVGPGRTIALAADPNPVSPGKFSVITATVTDSGGSLVSGAEVRFYLTTGNGELSRSDLKTNGDGVATIIYYAWNNLEDDIIQATTDKGGFDTLIIKKGGQTIGFTATMTANPQEFTGKSTDPPGTIYICNTVLSVTVVQEGTGTTAGLPAANLRVRFNPITYIDPMTHLVTSINSNFTPASGVTGIDGKLISNLSVELPVGTFIVSAYVDLNDNGAQDENEPTAAVAIKVTQE